MATSRKSTTERGYSSHHHETGKETMDNNQPTTIATDQELNVREYVVSEIESALAEMRIPMNTGLIARSKLQHLRDVLVAWPNVTVFGKPTSSPNAGAARHGCRETKISERMRITEVMLYDAAGGPDAADVIVAVIHGEDD